MESTQNIKTIKCDTCDKIVSTKDAYSAYDGIFCSMKCLEPYRKIKIEEKEKTQKNIYVSKSRPDCGGPTCF